MAQKIQLIIENYDAEERIVEGIKVEADGTKKRFREKGLNVEEFKKLVRKKFGDGVEIINKVRKNRSTVFGTEVEPHGSNAASKDDRFDIKDIHECIKNKL